MIVRKVSITLLYLFALFVISLVVLYYKNISESSLYDIYVDSLISRNFQKAFPNLAITIGKTQVDNNSDGYKVILSGILIRNKDGVLVSKIPKIYADVRVTSFFSSFVITSLHIENPQLISFADSGVSEFNLIAVASKVAEYIQNVKITDLVVKERTHLQEIHFSSVAKYGSYKMNFNIKKDVQSSVQIEAKLSSTSVMSLQFSNIDLSIFGILPEEYQDIHLDGYSSFTFNQLGKIKNGNIVINNVSGKFKSGHGKLSLLDEVVTIEDLTLSTNNSDLFVSGKYNTSNHFLDFQVKSNAIIIEELFNLWPKTLNHDAWNWCKAHIMQGVFIDPTLHIKGDIYQDYNFNIKTSFTDGKFVADEIFAPITQLGGHLSIENSKLFMQVDHAMLDEIAISDGVVKQEGVSSTASSWYIYGTTESTVNALYPLIENKGKLDFIANINGIAKSDFSFESTEKQFNSMLNIEMYKVYDNNFINIFKLDDGRINISIDNKNWELHGGMLADNKHVNMVINGNAEEVEATLNGKISADIIEKLGIHNEKYITGALDYDINVKNIDGYNYIEGSVELSNADIDLYNIGWYSNIGSPGLLNFHLINKEKSYIISDFEVDAHNVRIKGAGKIDGNELKDLIFHEMQIGDNHLECVYTKTEGIKKLFLKADKLTIDTFDDLDSAGDSKFDIKAKIGEATLKNNILISDLQVNLNPDYVGSYINGNFSTDKSFFIERRRSNMVGWSDDAGLFLKAFGINNGINKGFLLLNYDHDSDHGSIVIKDFYLIEAPVLAKILSLVSLQGIVDTLNNDGIYFNQLRAPFSYNDKILYFDESWLEGLSLGISFEGQVNIASNEVDVTGHVVPIYYINKMIWQIPLFGKLLTGGKGRGVISIDYGLKTDQEGESHVSVNMMSILTPKLLQRVFELL